jgi:hypothetical protein
VRNFVRAVGGKTLTEGRLNDTIMFKQVRSQWPCRLRCESAASVLLGMWVQIPSGAWMSLSCECCVLSSRGLCDGLVTRPGESYRV